MWFYNYFAYNCFNTYIMLITEKYFDKLPNKTINKFKKAMYRYVDLIELFFPDPRNINKRIVLDDHQKDFIDMIQYGFPLSKFKFNEITTTPKGVILITRRQVGKSVGFGCTGAASMIAGPGMGGTPPCFNGIVAASEEQSFLLIDKVKYNIENSDFNDFVIGRPKLDKIKLINGSYTKAHTCSHKSIRGPAYDYMFIDEGAQMDQNILFSAAIPTVTHGYRWAVITTPQGSKGQLVEKYIKAVELRPILCKKCGAEYSQKHFPEAHFPDKNRIWEMPKLPKCEHCGANDYKYGISLFGTPWLNPWKCKLIDPVELRAELDAFDWNPWVRQELLGEIVDEASMIILIEWIEKNINKQLRNTMTKNTNNFYVLGLDYGRTHDASSFCVTHRNPQNKKIVLDYMRTVSGEFDFQTDYDGIHKHLEEIVKFYKPSLIVPDATGLGYSQVERMQKDLRFWSPGTRIYNSQKNYFKKPREKRRIGFLIERSNKPELIGNMISLLSQNPPQLELPPRSEPEIRELVTELLRFECKVLDTGYIDYGTQDYHDDRVIAFALSLWGHITNRWFMAKPKGFNYVTIPTKKNFTVKTIKLMKDVL